MIDFNLKNRVAVITGGAQGFGFAIAKRFIASGANVIIWDINEEISINAVKELGLERSEYKIVDVRSYENVSKSLEDVEKKYETLEQPYSTASHLTSEPYTMMDIPVDHEGNVIKEKDVPRPQGPVPDPHTSFFNKMGNYSSVFKKTFFKK